MIEYDHERDGEIIVPAGGKAVDHIRNGDRSGYVDIQFASLLMPDVGTGTTGPAGSAPALVWFVRWSTR